VLTDGAVRMDSGKLFQIRGAAELKARLANTVLSAGWESRWRSQLTPLKKLTHIQYINSMKQVFQYAIELGLFDDRIIFN